jgi:hypothetical protein
MTVLILKINKKKVIRKQPKNKLTIKLLFIVSTILSIGIYFVYKEYKESYYNDLEIRLINKLPLSQKEKNDLCKYFLGTDKEKYKKYCLNQDTSINNLLEKYLYNRTNISYTDSIKIDSIYLDFFKKLDKARSIENKTGKNLLTESKKVVNSYKEYIRRIKHKIKYNVSTKDIYLLTLYVYTQITNEKILNNYEFFVSYKKHKIIVNKFSLLHIIVRHYFISNYYINNNSTLYKYTTYNELIIELQKFLKAISFSEQIDKTVLFESSQSKDIQNYSVYMFNDSVKLDLHLIKLKNTFFVETFFVHDSSAVSNLSDNRKIKTTNCNYYNLINNVKIFYKDDK